MGAFAASIAAFAESTKGRIRMVAIESIIGFMDRVVQRSPVDTGLFRGNWQVRVNAKPSGPIERLDKQPLGSPMGVGERGAARANLSALVLGDHVWVTNELPYAQRLEYEGWSNQAPNGQLRLARIEWSQILQAAAAKVNR